MSSINTLIIIFIYFIFVLFQFNTCQEQCSEHGETCDNINSKCCKGLNCKNERIEDSRIIGDVFQYRCFYAGCVHDGNFCDDNGRMCCFGSKCDNSVCRKCTINSLKCSKNGDCCSGICNGGLCIPYTPIH
ncbi:unnamed protein product [Meloidogyne enterolobii]|uniref:Uncharacterized protein n=1 Tax=Meloidogyne enterolobii TaxID=390850 RepID=A0ACB0Z4Z5_MELEN